MTKIRLLPVVILVVGALLVLKTVGLVTQGHYVINGVLPAMAAGGAPAAEAPVGTPTAQQPTLPDASPTLADQSPTVGGNDASASGYGTPAAGGYGEAAADPAAVGDYGPVETGYGNSVAIANACEPKPAGDGEQAGGQLTVLPGGCPPLTDAAPQIMTPGGVAELGSGDVSLTEQVLLDRLASRRTELEAYEQELSLRASLVDAAEKRVEERTSTLAALEAQIASLVDERKRLEQEQFTSIVAMYSTMKPKDAAAIFDELEIDVLVRVAKMMTPRKLAPVLAAMTTARAQELTIRLASQTSENPEQMQPADVAALPQIVGQ